MRQDFIGVFVALTVLLEDETVAYTVILLYSLRIIQSPTLLPTSSTKIKETRQKFFTESRYTLVIM